MFPGAFSQVPVGTNSPEGPLPVPGDSLFVQDRIGCKASPPLEAT